MSDRRKFGLWTPPLIFCQINAYVVFCVSDLHCIYCMLFSFSEDLILTCFACVGKKHGAGAGVGADPKTPSEHHGGSQGSGHSWNVGRHDCHDRMDATSAENCPGSASFVHVRLSPTLLAMGSTSIYARTYLVECFFPTRSWYYRQRRLSVCRCPVLCGQESAGWRSSGLEGA